MASPGDILNLGTTSGRNHFNIGIGFPSGHVDHSPADIEGGYSSDPEFIGVDSDTWCRFRVPMNGGTTSSGTKYPRSELREYNEAGTSAISFDGGSGTHTMQATSRIAHVPPVKPWVCFFQIHNGDSDVCRVQTEGTSPSALKIVGRSSVHGTGSETVTTLMASYTLLDPIAWKMEIVDGLGTVYLNGASVMTFPADDPDLYFKCGAYAQTNDTIDSASEYVAVDIKAGTLIQQHPGWATNTSPGDTGGTGGTGSLVFDMGFGSCIDPYPSDSDALAVCANMGVDYFAQLGDPYYDDGGSGYETHWDTQYAQPGYAALLSMLSAKGPLAERHIYTWSDHDAFANDAVSPAFVSANAAFRSYFPDVPVPSYGIYNSFEIGRVLFIKCDERSFKDVQTDTDDSSKTVLGADQKAWFENLITTATNPLIVILGDIPITTPTTAGDDAWSGYDTERQWMQGVLDSTSATKIRLSGNQHCLARTSNAYGYDRAWQAAPLNKATKVSAGGVGMDESYPTNANEGTIKQLFGVVTFTDDGTQITADFKGYEATSSTAKTLRISDTITVSAPGGLPGGDGGGGTPTYAISNVRAGNTAIVGNAPTTPALPAGLVKGDLLLMRDTVIRFSTTTQPATPGTPAGWTMKATEASPVGAMAHASIRYTWYYARYDPAGVDGVSAAPTVTYTGAAGDEHHTQITACTSAWADGDPTDVLGAFAVSAANSSTQIGPAPGITTTFDGGLVVGIIAAEYDATGGIGNFTGESLAWVEDDEHGDGVSNDWAYGYDHALIPSARTIADKTLACTQVTAGRSVGQLWAIKPKVDSYPVRATGPVLWQTKGRAIAAARLRWATKSSPNGVRKVRFKVRTNTTTTRPVLWEVKRSAIAAATVRWAARGRAIAARTARYKVRRLRAGTRRARWNVRDTATATRPVSWSTRIRAAADTRPVRWAARVLAARVRRARWSTRALLPAPRPVAWSVRVLSGVDTRAIAWSVRALTRATRAAAWSTRARTATTRALRWAVRVTAPVTTRAARWSARSLVGDPRPVSWSTRVTSSTARAVSWSTRVLSGTAARVARWDVRAPAGVAGTVRWLVTAPTVRVARAAAVRWDTRANLTSGRTGRWQVRALAASTPVARWDTRATVAAPRAASWAARVLLSVTRRPRWAVRALTRRARPVRWDTRTLTGDTITARWAVRALTATTRRALWDTRAHLASTAPARWAVRHLTTSTRTTRWANRATTPATRAARWATRAVTHTTRAARWRITRAATTARALLWDNRTHTTTTRTARWGTRHLTSSTRRARWAVVGVARAARRVRWRIVQTADQALIPGRLTATATDGSHLTATSSTASTLSATATNTGHLTATTSPDPEE